MYKPNLDFLAQFGGEIGEEQLFFKVKKEKTPHIFPPNWLRRFGFLICYTTFDPLSICVKKGNFFEFDPSAPPPPN